MLTPPHTVNKSSDRNILVRNIWRGTGNDRELRCRVGFLRGWFWGGVWKGVNLEAAPDNMSTVVQSNLRAAPRIGSVGGVGVYALELESG